MLLLSTYRLTKSELPIITDNYQILHFDEYPILFIGTNKYGNKLIGSLADDDEDNNVFSYFTVILDDETYNAFLNKQITYRDIILNSDEIYIVQKDINGNILSKCVTEKSLIPSEYIPLENSYMPEFSFQEGQLNFSFSLKGKLADLHKAIVEDINIITEKIYVFLQEGLEVINHLNLDPVIYSQPSSTGSYRLNFDIEFRNIHSNNLFNLNLNKVTSFVQEFLTYLNSINTLEELIHNKDTDTFKDLFKKLEDISLNNFKEKSSISRDFLNDQIYKSTYKLYNVSEYLKDANSFDRIEFGNRNVDGNFKTLGFIYDNKHYIRHHEVMNKYIAFPDETFIDSNPQDYRILVYRINKETGKGAARLYLDDSEKYQKINLIILNNHNDLANTIFTQSLDENKVVTVKGKATIIDGVYRKLVCDLTNPPLSLFDQNS
ncbi:hypothetical protein ACKW6Q_11575 [Chryseobacterium kwangjuense]|uniref:Uncharacterized protein n=1 Tax=Chryseobacterium kwangjuense TaxID=267125 RepID=A0ABW9K523_9FLAO